MIDYKEVHTIQNLFKIFFNHNTELDPNTNELTIDYSKLGTGKYL